MSDPMLAIVGAWLGAVLAGVKDLVPTKGMRVGPVRLSRRKMVVVGLFCASISAVFGIAKILRAAEAKVVWIDSEWTQFNEGSGATAWGANAIVVDDEHSSIQVLRFENGRYRYERTIPITRDGQPVGKYVDDLEGAAISPAEPDTLYLVTSHSNRKGNRKVMADPEQEMDPENLARRRLLRVSLKEGQAGEIEACLNLRAAFERKLFGEAIRVANRHVDHDGDTAMQIEGLAADGEHLYFGFRAPMTLGGPSESRAIVIRAKTADLFREATRDCDSRKGAEGLADKLTVLPVAMAGDHGERYSMSSLEWDAPTRMFVALAAHADSYESSPRAVCVWDGVSTTSNCRPLPAVDRPFSGKQEAVAIRSGTDAVVTFIDGDNTGKGGQIVYRREEVGLPSAR